MSIQVLFLPGRSILVVLPKSAALLHAVVLEAEGRSWLAAIAKSRASAPVLCRVPWPRDVAPVARLAVSVHVQSGRQQPFDTQPAARRQFDAASRLGRPRRNSTILIRA